MNLILWTFFSFASAAAFVECNKKLQKDELMPVVLYAIAGLFLAGAALNSLLG